TQEEPGTGQQDGLTGFPSNQGIYRLFGKQLIRHSVGPALCCAQVARKCELLGRALICLDVRAGTHAAIWWQHFGFKQYGLLQDYSRVGNKQYQGLYLTQTTAALKKCLHEI